MKIVLFLIFVSLCIVLAGVVFFIYSVKNEDFDNGTQMSLKPLEDDR